jgi:ElaB/YqjD/DUF883 family membrane-anchored ribosome-binding protein
MSQTKFQTAPTFEDRATQTVSDAANAAGAAVRGASNQIRDAAADLGARARSNADDAVSELAKRVEQQPLSAVLVAGGVGLLVGLLLARR